LEVFIYHASKRIITFSYIKLIPIRPWDDNFHTSVWFFNIKGINDEGIVNAAVAEYNKHTEIESMKMWLKLSRQNFKNQSCQFLKLKGINSVIKKIEHPLLTSLYESLMKGEYGKAESTVNDCLEKGLLDYYIKTLPYNIIWKKLDLVDDFIDKFNDDLNYEVRLGRKTNRNPIEIESENYNSLIQNIGGGNDEESVNLDAMSLTFLDDLESQNIEDNLGYSIINAQESLICNHPVARGGHCMALDEENGVIYIFGGWTGTYELCDFWSFNIHNSQWNLLSANTFNDGGPNLSSCGKMVYDSVNKRLFIYGKIGQVSNFDDYLYEYTPATLKWKKLKYQHEKVGGSIVTGSGPGQVFDLQMVMDSFYQQIYLFGGFRVPETDNGNHTFLTF
jgi:hypothetical protein